MAVQRDMPPSSPSEEAARWLGHHASAMTDLTDRCAFQSLCAGPLKSLLGHAAALAIIGRITRNRFAALAAVNVGYPDLLAEHALRGGDISTRPLLAMWLQRRAPLFIDPQLAQRTASPLERQEIEQHRLGCMAIHGVVELSGSTGTYFSFSGFTSGDCESVAAKLALVIPHLHGALLGVWRTECASWVERVSPAEHDLLQALAGGLTNPQIAHLRGRSPATVRNQLHHLIEPPRVSRRLVGLSQDTAAVA